MSIVAGITHITEYRYDRPVRLSAQVIRLRPAPHARTPVVGYSLKVEPAEHFLNWLQDPQGNWMARVVFPDPVEHFKVSVDLLARMDVFNPFDFFIEESAETVPFVYAEELAEELAPFRKAAAAGPLLREFLADVHQDDQRTIDFLVDLNQRLAQKIRGSLVDVYGLPVVPKQAPDMAAAEQLYQTHCFACHGREGHGDGPALSNIQKYQPNIRKTN